MADIEDEKLISLAEPVFLALGRSAAAAAAKSLQSCPTLCNLIDGSPPGSAVPGILQARTLEWVAISFSNAQKWKVKVKSLSRVRPLDCMDCSPSGSRVRGIFQSIVLEWGAIAFSAGEVWLMQNADTQCTLGRRGEAQTGREELYALSCLSMWVFISSAFKW